MAKVFTQEEREKIKWQVVELVRQSGRETLRQLEAKTGATRYLMSVLARELVASGDVYNSGYGLPLDDEKSVHERVDNARIDLRSKYYVKPKADHPWLTRRTQSHQQVKPPKLPKKKPDPDKKD
ncbi:DUF977 family protein [Escherichia coli]|nr:DUF977 family protein [Escherichia coli]HCU6268336.1 DUF977 family protein [Escherichia coli]HCU6303783.1 DUF977 family protein [Escherichia coli]